MKTGTRIVLFIVSLILFRLSMEIWLIRTELLLISDYGTVLGVCVLIVIALGSKRASTVLKKPFFKFLGNISYSTYLSHIAILYLAFFLLHDSLPVPLILPAYVVAVVVVSFFAWKAIELPSIALGRVWSNRFDTHRFRK